MALGTASGRGRVRGTQRSDDEPPQPVVSPTIRLATNTFSTSATAGHLSVRRPLLITFGSVLSPDGGTQVRSRVLAEALTELGSAPSIISTREPRVLSSRPVPHLARALSVPRRRPWRGMSWELVRLIRREAAGSDAVVIASAMFMPAVALSRTRLPLIWDTVECQTLHYRRLRRTPMNLFRLAAWTWLERWTARRSAIAIAIGDEEACAWRRLRPELNGKLVTVDHSAPAQPRSARQGRMYLEAELGRPVDGPVLLFVGTLRAKHNAAAARWLLEVLAPTLGDHVTLVLCGRGSEALRPLPTRATVAALGFVEDVDALIAAADVCLAPLASGAGVHTKVLHYLAHGRQVLGTPVAFEGLAGAPGLIPVTLADLPRRLRRLIEQPESAADADDRARRQRAWLEVNHSHAHVVDQWRITLSANGSSRGLLRQS
jgi:glycosyltransferase involved in cell wall biosynthesis